MAFFYQTLFSGSEGNSCLVGFNGCFILIDAGGCCKRLLESLSAVSVSPNDISAVYVTHEHSDHIGALDVFARKYKIPVFANAPTAAEIRRKCRSLPDSLVFDLDNGQTAKRGGLCVTPFPLPHDSISCSGYIIEAQGKRLVAATDMGYLSGDFARAARDADALLIESNYDCRMLADGPYPPMLKRRISSDYGHLSNDGCAEAVSLLASRRVRQIVLAHLSKENNTPETACGASRNAIVKKGGSVTGDADSTESDVLLTVAPRYQCGKRVTIIR